MAGGALTLVLTDANVGSDYYWFDVTPLANALAASGKDLREGGALQPIVGQTFSFSPVPATDGSATGTGVVTDSGDVALDLSFVTSNEVDTPTISVAGEQRLSAQSMTIEEYLCE
jgi:hypothetical protein